MEKLSVKDFKFDLPPELIAQTPLSERSSSRLLLLDKSTGKIFHRHFYDIAEYINEGDCLVLNDTRVIPARLIGERYLTGAKVELLLLKRMEIDVWETLVYPGKKAKPGDIISFGNCILLAEILSVTDGGNRIVKFKYDGVFEQILDKLGEMPLPPYITKKLQDKNRYQTVYAKNEGSAAAPTAGLHFTDDLLNSIVQKGAEIAKITLHVGLGTFRPVKTDDITEHEMHSEYFNIPQTEAAKINTAKKAGKKVISVGTTSTRTIESMANINTDNGCFVKSGNGWTNIFIYPPYKFKVVDSLITNFHLPESTLIMLVSALAGRENVLNAYNEAVINKYRFFSFGDAMFISDIVKQ